MQNRHVDMSKQTSKKTLHLIKLSVSFLLEQYQPWYFLEVGRPVDVARPLNKSTPPLTVQVYHHIWASSAALKGGEGGSHHGVGDELPPDLVRGGSQRQWWHGHPPPPNPGDNVPAPAAPSPPLRAEAGAGAPAPRGWWGRSTSSSTDMSDTTGAKPVQFNVNCRYTVLLCMKLSGAGKVAPQAIGGVSGDAVSHGNPTI